jgi:hypothetical protein
MGAPLKRNHTRGVALATSLMLSVLILVLGIALLSTSQRDLFFQRQQQARDKAEILARSGLEHSLYLLNQEPSLLDPSLPVNTPVTFDVVAPTETFVLERRQDAVTSQFALVVQGVVRHTNGQVLATRTIIVPYGPDSFLTEAELETQSYSQEL